MKLIIITDAWHPQVNGVVRTYENLSEQLEKLGHTVKVVGPCEFPRRIAMPGYSEIQLAIRPYARLKKIIDEYEPDCIHVSTEGPLGWAGRKYCLKHDKKFSTSYHTHFPHYVAKRCARFMPFLYNTFYSLAKSIVKKFHAPSSRMMVATQSLEDELKSWPLKTPMHRLSRGVKLDLFYPGEQTLYKDLKKPIALYVGRVAIEKNLEAFLSMDWEGSKLIVGDGPSLKALQSQYPDAVFVGSKQGQELAEHYRAADVFIFPSKTDTFGIVLIEALASGLPIAGYNVTGPKDIVVKPFLGALTEDDLGKAAKEAMQNGTAQQRADYTKSNFTWKNAGKQFEKGLVNNNPKAEKTTN